VLFGFTLTVLSSLIGIAAGAVQGYFGGWIDLSFQRFSRSGPACRRSIC
jgi:microcin C transport system permease protein